MSSYPLRSRASSLPVSLNPPPSSSDTKQRALQPLKQESVKSRGNRTKRAKEDAQKRKQVLQKFEPQQKKPKKAKKERVTTQGEEFISEPVVPRSQPSRSRSKKPKPTPVTPPVASPAETVLGMFGRGKKAASFVKSSPTISSASLPRPVFDESRFFQRPALATPPLPSPLSAVQTNVSERRRLIAQWEETDQRLREECKTLDKQLGKMSEIVFCSGFFFFLFFLSLF
jgi:hypothetical protein